MCPEIFVGLLWDIFLEFFSIMILICHLSKNLFIRAVPFVLKTTDSDRRESKADVES